jgi:hypothetical protein
MSNAFALHLPFSMRRYRGSVAPYFANGAGSANMPIQYQLPEICVVFLKRVFFNNDGLFAVFPLRGFAPLREPLALSRRAGRFCLSHAKTRRREGKNVMSI